MKLPTLALALLAALICFIAGRKTAPERGIVVAVSEYPGHIEVREDGLVTSEWEVADGEEYRVLADLVGLPSPEPPVDRTTATYPLGEDAPWQSRKRSMYWLVSRRSQKN